MNLTTCCIPDCYAIIGANGVFCLDHFMKAVNAAGQERVESYCTWRENPEPPFAPRHVDFCGIMALMKETK